MDELSSPRGDRSHERLSEPSGPFSNRPLRLGRYRMLAQVGSGGGATVFLALASGAAGVNKLLVAKVLKADLADDPSFVAMFLDEARLTTRLSHPNIVQTLEVGMEDGLHFIVMEYLEGKPLSRLGGAKIPGIGRDVLVQLIAESLGGLHYAHELADYDGTPLGVVHRDYSPQNVFVTYDGTAKLLDFGVAKMLNSSVRTEADILKGKPRYMAPEQMRAGPIDRRADIFSAGVVLWEAVAGERMWAGKNDMAVLFAVGGGQIPRLEEVAPGTPAELVRIAHRALAPEPDDRYATALAMQEDLEAYLRTSREVLRSRDIGRILKGHFAADRAQISAGVEAQLRALATESRRFRVVSLPEIETGALGGAFESSGARSFPASDAPVAMSGTHGRAVGRRRAGFLGFLGAAVLLAAAAGSVLWVTPTAQIHEWIAMTGAHRRAAEEPAPPADPAIVTPRASLPPAAVAEETVKLTFRASPPEARMFLDGVALGTNPFSGRFTKGGTAHILRVEAPGFAPREEPFTFARDADLDLTLTKRGNHPGAADRPALRPPPQRVAPVAPPPHASAPPAGPPAAADSVVPVPPSPPSTPPPAASAARKKRPVDPTDPYAD